MATEDTYVLQTAQLEEGGNLFPLFLQFFSGFLRWEKKSQVPRFVATFPIGEHKYGADSCAGCAVSIPKQLIGNYVAESQFWFLVRVEVAGFFLSSPHLVISSRILVLVKSPAQ